MTKSSAVKSNCLTEVKYIVPKEKVKFRTVLSGLTTGEQARYIGRPIHNGTRDREYIVNKVATRGGIDKATASYVIDLFFEQLGTDLANGYHIEYGAMAGNLTIQGGFEYRDSAWDPERNRLVPRLHAKGELAACTADVVCENDTPSAKVVIDSVIDTVHEVESELAEGTNVVVLVAGIGLVTSTDTESGEGVWLENEDTGVVAAVGTVTASTPTTLDATFATMPEPGNYRFVIATRGGMGSEYGVVVAKRKVTVVAADSANMTEV